MTTSNHTNPVAIERISQSILFLRGYRVILDKDLAAIYGVETRALNQAVKRNAERFPEDFRFQLTAQEALAARSQTETKASGSGRNIKYLPYAFTEHGAIQAANVVNSSRAIRMSIYVVRAFVQLRSVLASNRDIAQKLVELERRIDSHDGAIVGILKTIRELMNLPERESRPIGFVQLEERSVRPARRCHFQDHDL